MLLIARSSDSLAEAAKECDGARTATLALDVTNPHAGERIVGAATDSFGHVDVLVNNAGTTFARSLEELTDQDWLDQYALHVLAPMRLMRAAAPRMAARGGGRIVNVSSSAGKRPSLTNAAYSVTKAAELSLSRVFADRYAKQGVLVNAVCPGPTRSELWMSAGGLLDQTLERGEHSSRDEALEAQGAQRPIGRMAEVGEIADAIAFLCSERASYVAGAAWSVDGGTVQVII